jgi:hypothetical protein
MLEHQGSIQPVSGPQGQRQEQRAVHGQQVQRHQDQPPLGEGKGEKGALESSGLLFSLGSHRLSPSI